MQINLSKYFLLNALGLILGFAGCKHTTDSAEPVNAINNACKLTLYKEKRIDNSFNGYKVDYNSAGNPSKISLLNSASGNPSSTNYDDYFYNPNNQLSRLDHYENGVRVHSRYFVFSKSRITQDDLYKANASDPITTYYYYYPDGNLHYTVSGQNDSTVFDNYVGNRPGTIQNYSGTALRSFKKRVFDSSGNLMRDSLAQIDDTLNGYRQFYLSAAYTYNLSKPGWLVPNYYSLLFPNDRDKSLRTSSKGYGFQINARTLALVQILGSSYLYGKFAFNNYGFVTSFQADEKITAQQDSYTTTLEYLCN